MSHVSNPLQALPVGVKTKLDEYRVLVRRVKITEAVLAAVFGFIVSYLLLFAIDRFVETPRWARVGLLLAGVVGFSVYLPYMLHRWVWNTRALTAVARLLQYQFPSLSDHVLSIVELANSPVEQRRSPQLIAAAMAQVDDRLYREDLTKGVPSPRIRRWAFLSIPVLVLTTICGVLVPTVAVNAWVRYLLPFANIERYTFARLEQLPEETVVPYAEPFELTLQLKEHSDWNPRFASLSMLGQQYQASLTPSKQYPFQLPGQLESSMASMRIGDATQVTRILPTLRPEIVRVSALVELPKYLEYPRPLELEARASSLTLLRGSQARLIAKSNRDLESAEVSVKRERRVSEEENVEPAVMETQLVPSEIQASEIRLSPIPIDGSMWAEYRWKDTLGLAGGKPVRINLRSVEDAAPNVSVSRLPDPPILLSTETLRFDVAAADDFGLKHIGLEWKSAPNQNNGKSPVAGSRLVVAGKSDAAKLEGLATLSCEQEKIIPQWLEIRAFTEDYLPERGRVYSVPYLVHVMSPEEHALWLADQIRRWKGKADAAYEEEVRLLEENRRIRDLDSKELDTQAARDRMAQQKAAEENNAKRLDSVVDDGQKLLEQALRNEEIRAKQIEQWAKALQSMNELAENRMPELAESIGKAAQSPNSPSSGTAKEGTPSIRDDQSSPYETPEAPKSSPSDEESPGSRLTIPETRLAPSPQKNEDEKKEDESEKGPAKKQMDDVVRDHSKLVEEFRKSKQAFEDLMTDFENSTFVKRLKAASQFQKQVAEQLTQVIGSNFGLPGGKAKAAFDETQQIVERQEILAEKIKSLVTDLNAYQANNPAGGREAVLKEMKERDVILKLEEMPRRISRNLRGDALHRSEFWADTFDRWAEELAGPGGGGGGGGGEDKDRLPPALLLDIMRIIGDEIDLRDETRTLNQLVTEDNKESEDIRDRTAGQAIQQMAIQERTLNVLNDIQALPESEKHFDDEMGKLKKGIEHMDDASSMLSDMRLGDDVIASETAAIEALIATRRGGGGGGGGDTPGDGSGAQGSTDRSPLDLVGPGSDRNSKLSRRQVGEGSGKTGRSLPEQYRQGLDRFLNRASKNR